MGDYVLKETKEDTDCAELSKVMNQTRADNNNTPDEHDSSHVLRRLRKLVENHVTRNLSENICSD